MLKRIVHIGLLVSGFSLSANAQTAYGTITDALLGTPVDGAKVTIAETAKICTTDVQGRYQTPRVQPGTYTLRVEAKGYLKRTRRVILKSHREVGSANLKVDLGLFSISKSTDASAGSMTVKYFFPGHANVEIAIYDEKGKRVRRAFDRSRRGGMRTFSWDGKDDRGRYVPPGKYSCRLAARNMVTIRDLVWKGPLEAKESEKGQEEEEDTESHKPSPAE